MEFRKATDILFDGVTQGDLAKILGVSVASIRQARLKEEAKARRSPPENWEKAVIRLAAKRIREYQRLISTLSAEQQGDLSFQDPEAHR